MITHRCRVPRVDKEAARILAVMTVAVVPAELLARLAIASDIRVGIHPWLEIGFWCSFAARPARASSGGLLAVVDGGFGGCACLLRALLWLLWVYDDVFCF